jgi:PT repeat
MQPSRQPTSRPSRQPTGQPSSQPSGQPFGQPSGQPSRRPTGQPTQQPSQQPTGQPTRQPTAQPTRHPTTSAPTGQPSRQPTGQPSQQPTGQPTRHPISSAPSGQPSRQPTSQPSRQPSAKPSGQPSRQPTSQPSRRPTGQPSRQPSMQPTSRPSRQPSNQPTSQPSTQPTGQPSRQPTLQPSSRPTSQPTEQPSRQPSVQPTAKPSRQPSSQPSSQPSRQPTCEPTSQPTSYIRKVLVDDLSTEAQSAVSLVLALYWSRSAYSGPIVRFRRSSDDVEDDFFADKDGLTVNAQGVSVWAWRDATNPPSLKVYCPVWYDQSGFNNHARQPAKSRQPYYNFVTSLLNFAPDKFLLLPFKALVSGTTDYPYTIAFQKQSRGNHQQNRRLTPRPGCGILAKRFSILATIVQQNRHFRHLSTIISHRGDLQSIASVRIRQGRAK